MSTHSLCFGSEIKEIAYPYKPHFHCMKVGFKGVFISWMFFPYVLWDNGGIAG